MAVRCIYCIAALPNGGMLHRVVIGIVVKRQFQMVGTGGR